ncbi:hypothetical protein [Pleionea litopenaei]|uniref:Uncharacterized protein n=1 Tax=Pleionea litopenaei TaxID=3070815 RepID=A0AA51X695_9GAMM|nr:hypothetical protein [Pleionea sp. HL-JVS1]WMS86591.1 hypothetical protein Q9312_15325 [Pleionea sp. HL-JVS1]
MKVSVIFEEEPTQWGLRGDPFLWRELKERFRNIDMPSSADELRNMIESEYEKSTGHPIGNMKNIGIERFQSYGMSSGIICPEFWVTKGVPLLASRHAKP